MWTVEKSRQLYHIDRWGGGYFDINPRGHVCVLPTRAPKAQIDLKVLLDELQMRGVALPILVRFTDILQHRLRELHENFARAIAEYDYAGEYRCVYPIKVNQQREVVDALLTAGRAYHFGLECGSKAELMAVLARMEDAGALVVCNGYKDTEYIDLAIHASRIGMQVVVVVEKFSDLEIIALRAGEYRAWPMVGLRLRLSAKGAGRWEASGGDRAKFGLGPQEVVQALAFLQQHNALQHLTMLHYHLGSQICAVQTLREALREAGRYYVEITRRGAGLRFLDVGGGLAVDYDGTQSSTRHSANYTLQEYANTVVYELRNVCRDAGVAPPTIVSESGRALTAHHSVLITNVLAAARLPLDEIPDLDYENAPPQVWELWDLWRIIDESNFREHYHDLQDARKQLLDLFRLGYISLEWRAAGEAIYWSALQKIWNIAARQSYLPDELAGLHDQLADIYYCNFSVFQSLPDWWAIGHLFPVMPIHRLDEEPTRHAVLADITCDSDGKIDRFVDAAEPRSTLPLHPLRPGEEYLLGVFLVGAYQEILGDLHNLFGDTNAVDVSWDEETRNYRVDHVEEGDSVAEVLQVVQYPREELVRRFREKVEAAVRKKRITIEESRRILESYRAGFDGYTYIEK